MDDQPTLKLGDTSHALIFDNRARFRFGALGGSIPAIFTPGQDYYQVCILLYSALPDAVRCAFSPEELAPHINPNAVEKHTVALTVAVRTWYPHGIEEGVVEPDCLAMSRPHLDGDR